MWRRPRNGSEEESSCSNAMRAKEEWQRWRGGVGCGREEVAGWCCVSHQGGERGGEERSSERREEGVHFGG